MKIRQQKKLIKKIKKIIKTNTRINKDDFKHILKALQQQLYFDKQQNHSNYLKALELEGCVRNSNRTEVATIILKRSLKNGN